MHSEAGSEAGSRSWIEKLARSPDFLLPALTSLSLSLSLTRKHNTTHPRPHAHV